MYDYQKKCAARLTDFVSLKIQEFQDEIDKKNKEIQKIVGKSIKEKD